MQRMLRFTEQFCRTGSALSAWGAVPSVSIQLWRGPMLRSDVSVAEKYRRLVEPIRLESDYGRTLEAGAAAWEQGR